MDINSLFWTEKIHVWNPNICDPIEYFKGTEGTKWASNDKKVGLLLLSTSKMYFIIVIGGFAERFWTDQQSRAHLYERVPVCDWFSGVRKHLVPVVPPQTFSFTANPAHPDDLIMSNPAAPERTPPIRINFYSIVGVKCSTREICRHTDRNPWRL